MLIDSFANRLNKALSIKNMRPSEIVRISEKLFDNGKINKPLTKPLLSHYLKGSYEAKQDNVYALSLILNVDEAWLMGYDVPMKKTNTDDLLKNMDVVPLSNIETVPIPLIGTVKAGYDYLAQENWEGTVDLSKKVADTGEFFALKVKGDSMVPIFFEGDIVVIRKQNDCENNQVAVVIVNGDEGTFKKVKKLDDGGIKLIPFNRTLDATGEPLYEDKTFSKEEIEKFPVIIAGVFEELRRTEIKF